MCFIEMLLEGGFKDADQFLGLTDSCRWEGWMDGFEEVAHEERRGGFHVDEG